MDLDRSESIHDTTDAASDAAPPPSAPEPPDAPHDVDESDDSEPAPVGSLPGATGTYSPEDNKLRLYPRHRLDADVYARVKAAGFGWAPKQGLFVAPMWTPDRADLLAELCGEIGDEDTALVDRAEERAERFEGYQERRAGDAERAHEAVAHVAQRFEGGQPILVGHHSERKARKDAERIQNGMRKAVKMWETSKYWEARAKGAIRHAKYKEVPAVRHRRIKGLEADERKHQKERAKSVALVEAWQKDGLTRERALAIANYDWITLPPEEGKSYGDTVWGALDKGKIEPEAARDVAVKRHEGAIRYHDRWLAHLALRITYEKAMLDESGGITVERQGFDVQVGGQVAYRFGWAIVLRLNRIGGVVGSYTVAGKYGRGTIGVEEVKDYRPPSEQDAAKVKAATKLPPIVNYPGEGFRHITLAQWKKWSQQTDMGGAHRIKATETVGAHRLRMVPKEGRPYYDIVGAYITDQKRVDPPRPAAARAPLPDLPPREIEEPRSPRPRPEPTVFDSMKETLKAGVQVVVAPQLFPTPPELAARVVRAAEIGPRHTVLEPSAGTGNLVRAIQRVGIDPTAVEIDARLCALLRDIGNTVHCADFLTLSPNVLGLFDRVVMNPPFAGAADVEHILHAFKFLKPGGRLVAICANGPRQRQALEVYSDSWQELPEGSFKESGTGVRTVLLTMTMRASAEA